MREHVHTLMWGNAWGRYGQTFAESYAKFWPGAVGLTVVTDRALPIDWARQIPLAQVQGYSWFMRRYQDDARAQGRESRDRKATPGERFWKHDAVKWAPQGLAPRAALAGVEDGDVLAWLDADVETVFPVPHGWLSDLLGEADVVCLQRNIQHSEIGFWAMRVGKGTRKAIDNFATLYSSGAIFRYPEWHSGYAFDRAIEDAPGLTIRNLAPEGMRGHVWPETPLAAYTVHKKGKLKDA